MERGEVCVVASFKNTEGAFYIQNGMADWDLRVCACTQESIKVLQEPYFFFTTSNRPVDPALLNPTAT